jgi:hypothetical protein
MIGTKGSLFHFKIARKLVPVIFSASGLSMCKKFMSKKEIPGSRLVLS